ncbi:hypothetical protein I6N96_02905 [Enterococcus sp. BWM-S5]|uniref:DUF3784 domain-containing protein n=1 Tax=Enterococcus larvae TaxID=2794352 RepID=A0ABS4CF00_9ENTE|nr:hypothetical protein [Enterococcus larvae]MBP1045213.1 hypothetical protein [Enterococcus larvae]
MAIQLLIFAAALLSIFVSFYIKKSFPKLASAFNKEIPADYFHSFSRLFLIIGLIGIPVAVFNHFYFSLLYIMILMILSTIFGLSFAKKI